MNKVPLYMLIGFLLLLSAYLHSPVLGVASVALWAVDVAAVVLIQHNKDAEIEALILRMEAQEKKLKSVEADVNNVADRASTILGETYR